MTLRELISLVASICTLLAFLCWPHADVIFWESETTNFEHERPRWGIMENMMGPMTAMRVSTVVVGLTNRGNRPATDLCLIFPVKPDHYRLTSGLEPDVAEMEPDVSVLEDGGLRMRIASLGVKETMHVSSLRYDWSAMGPTDVRSD